MDLRLLEIFCRVYKKRSFSAAARELQLTQPTVSAHIKELEESLGAPVFSRLGREIQPTEAGRLLYEHAKPIVGLKRNVMETMAGFLNRIEGVLIVGASSVPGECLLPRLITDFHALHPQVRGRLRISDTASTLEDVRHGDVELGVVGATMQEDDLVFEPLAEDALVLVVPGTAEWKDRTRVSMRQLRELPLIVREAGSGSRAVLERALARRRVQLSELNVVAELGSLGATKTAVKEGYGVSFISERAVASEHDAGLVRIARLTALGRIPRTYYSVFSRRRALSPLTRAFVQHLRGSAGALRVSARTSLRKA